MNCFSPKGATHLKSLTFWLECNRIFPFSTIQPRANMATQPRQILAFSHWSGGGARAATLTSWSLFLTLELVFLSSEGAALQRLGTVLFFLIVCFPHLAYEHPRILFEVYSIQQQLRTACSFSFSAYLSFVIKFDVFQFLLISKHPHEKFNGKGKRFG